MPKKKDKDNVAELYTPLDLSRERVIARIERFDRQDGSRSEFRRDYARLIHCPGFRRLQGKTQLFPGSESDFFRNRLTHSLEVAQIAKGIALQLNSDDFFKNRPLNTDLVEFAALAHDIGHPPFGHNGEYALDECMRDSGGFEGNAQTLRIVTRLEKREYNGPDGTPRCGLNLTHRSIAAVLKYDRQIPKKGKRRENPKKLAKGYYESEAELVARVKKSVAGDCLGDQFKTIECDIMDIADDIAYSTYDLEDAFKAGFLNPLEILSLLPGKLLERVTEKVAEATAEKIDAKTVGDILLGTFGGCITGSIQKVDVADARNTLLAVIEIYASSKRIASNGYLRTDFTSELVKEFISGVSVDPNRECPSLSKVKVKTETRLKIETLKHLTFEALTMSPRMRLVEYRGRDIVKSIFEALTSKKRKGHLLLPDDWRDVYLSLSSGAERKRLVCDFVAGMTDRYAGEFYARLTSAGSELSFFKPF